MFHVQDLALDTPLKHTLFGTHVNKPAPMYYYKSLPVARALDTTSPMEDVSVSSQ